MMLKANEGSNNHDEYVYLIYNELKGLFRGNGGLKTATTPVFIHAKWHSVFDLEVECVYQSIQGTPYQAYFVCF